MKVMFLHGDSEEHRYRHPLKNQDGIILQLDGVVIKRGSCGNQRVRQDEGDGFCTSKTL